MVKGAGEDENLNLSTDFNFDRPHATQLVEIRQAVLREILRTCVQEQGLWAALDAGCGVGYFSPFLRDMGLKFRRLVHVHRILRRRGGGIQE
jgi:2-polyprenyl-3-methyl-5-hydroxy-6-metoxy-1,4-benzoquinol methylase